MRTIPNLFGIDGFALPPEMKKYGAKDRKNEVGDFQRILDGEMEKIKGKEGKDADLKCDGSGRSCAFSDRRIYRSGTGRGF